MYERSAIVLERYFANLLEYVNECNVKENYSNYIQLVEKLEKFQTNYRKEYAANQDFGISLKEIKDIQANQEKLYKRSAKLEYNRNLLFNNVDTKVEDIARVMEKIEADVDKNAQDMKQVRESFINALDGYNSRRAELAKCRRLKKMAENEYNEVYEETRDNFDGIFPETIAKIKAFSKFKDEADIISVLEENGKDEKIPFNEEVMACATAFSTEIAKKEAAIYLVVYDKMTKLLNDIDNGSARIELHKKYARNEKAKIDFLLAAKDYVVQFLDYERMTVIHGRKSHNRLMSEACENFRSDINQINNLYELLLKETANKATKKAYKELYNKSYISDIKQKEEKFKKEKNRVNLNTATLVNSNYWRIEGIRNIYQVFYYNVSEVFGRNVQEYDLPNEFANRDDGSSESDDDTLMEDIIEEVDNEEIPFIVDEPEEPVKKETRGRKKKVVVEEVPVESEKDEPVIEDEDEDTSSDEEDDAVLDEDVDTISDEDDDDDDESIFPNTNFKRKKLAFDILEKEEDEEEEVDETEEDMSDEEESVYESKFKIKDYEDILNENLNKDVAAEDFDIFGEKYKNVNFDVDVLPAKIKRQNVNELGEVVEEDNSSLFKEIEDLDNKEENANNNDEIEDIDVMEVKPKRKVGGVFKKLRKAPQEDEDDENLW